jgi:hypothetical protein
MNRLVFPFLALLSCSAVVLAVDPTSFSDGFEAAVIDPFWTAQQSNGSITLSATQAHGGVKSAQFTRTTGGQLSLSLSHTFQAPQFGTASVWFYDSDFYCYASFALENTVGGGGVASWGIQDWDYYTYYYNMRNASGSRPQNGTGWHQFTIANTPTRQYVFLDGAEVNSASNDNTGFNKISLNTSGPSGSGSYYFDDFTFRSYALPTILTPPRNAVVAQGTNAVFSVLAIGEAPLSYQWQLNGTNVAGATGSDLTVTNAQPASEGNYRVIVANNTSSVTSGVVTLDVMLPPTVVTASASSVTNFSATLNGTVNPNGTDTKAFFEWGTTTAYGSTTPVQALGSDTNVIAVSAAISNLTHQTTYYYRLVATSDVARVNGGSESLTTLSASPKITVHPQSQLVPQGSNATFLVTATGLGTLTYQWQINGTNLTGSVFDSLVLTNVQATSAGPYRVIVSNAYGSTTSSVATLTIQLPPTAVTGSASSISTVRALLAGSVNPNGTAAGGFFEWGTTTAYGNSTPAQSAGSGTGSIGLSATLSNLTHLTTYHFRMVATNSSFRSEGGDATFTTLAARPVLSSFTPVVGTVGTTVTLTGTNLTGVTYVGFNGVSATFTVLSDNQIQAVVPAGATYGRIAVAGPGGIASSTANFVVRPVDAVMSGPFYPPPLGCSFSESYADKEAPIGRAGGKTWYFYNVALAENTVVYWGATNRGVRLSFVRYPFPEPQYPNEVLNYAESLSDLRGGVAVWTGQTFLPPSMSPVYTRFTLRIKDETDTPLALMNAAAMGLPGNVGAVLVVTPGLMFQANMLFEASFSPSGPFSPAIEFYDAQSTPAGGGTAYTSFSGGFWYENTPPVFTSGAFTNTTVNMGMPTAPINFTFTDAETGPSSVTVILPCASSNQTLLPNGNIPVTRTAADAAYLRAYPLPGQFGKTRVTVSITDGALNRSQSFELSVNSPPALRGLVNRVTQKNQPGGPWAFTLVDPDSPPESLTVEATSGNTLLVPNANIVLDGTGTNRTITVTPAAGQTGTATITVTVSDGLGQSSGSFAVKVNAPPTLTRNDRLYISQGSEQAIPSDLLAATDTESPASNLTYTVAFSGQGSPPHNGWLRLNGSPLQAGSTFTQEDIDLGRLSYLHDGGCSTDDDFTFNVSDADGGVTPTGQYVTYTFRISIARVNHPPIALNGSADIALGSTFLGSFNATDSDCPPITLTYRVLTNAVKGTLTLIDAGTGAFRYEATPGATGTDRVTFQVNDGEVDSAVPGVFIFTLANQPPVATAGSATTKEDVPVSGFLTASDSDQPPQPLVYRLVTPALKGSVTLVDTNSGAFLYQPNPGAIGADSFTFAAHDGEQESVPGTFAITIRPNVDPGDLIVSDSMNRSVVLVDGAGEQFVLSVSNLLHSPKGIAVSPTGTIAVMDQNGVVQINPSDGSQILLAAAGEFTSAPLGPVGIAFERDGSLLVADGTAGIKRVNPTNGTVSVVASGGSLILPEGVAVSTNGDIYVADLSAFAGQASRIVRLNPITGAQTVVSLGDKLVAPVGIALDNNGTIIVSDAATFGGAPFDSVLQVDPITGIQTVISTNRLLAMPTGLALASCGRIVTANQGSGTVVQIQRESGEQSVISSGGNIAQPFGVAVVHRLELRSPELLPDGRFTFKVFGEPGETYRIDRSDDLRIWQKAGSVSNATSLADFIDATSSGQPQRFYKARTSE